MRGLPLFKRTILEKFSRKRNFPREQFQFENFVLKQTTWMRFYKKYSGLKIFCIAKFEKIFILFNASDDYFKLLFLLLAFSKKKVHI